LETGPRSFNAIISRTSLDKIKDKSYLWKIQWKYREHVSKDKEIIYSHFVSVKLKENTSLENINELKNRKEIYPFDGSSIIGYVLTNEEDSLTNKLKENPSVVYFKVEE